MRFIPIAILLPLPVTVKVGSCSFLVPLQLSYLIPSLQEAAYILELGDDWDDQGSPGYTAETLSKAIRFLIDYAQWLTRKYPEEVWIKPTIYPGYDGGIDLRWKTDHFRMLIRMDKAVTEVLYYARNAQKQKETEGDLNADQPDFTQLLLPIQQESPSAA